MGCALAGVLDALRNARSARPSPFGAVAQLGERLLCKQEVTSSILVGSTTLGFQISDLKFETGGRVAQLVRACA